MSIIQEKIRKFLELNAELQQVANAPIDGRFMFNLVFGEHGLRDQIVATHIPVEWDNPDMDYEDDVRAYANAVRDVAEEIRKIGLPNYGASSK